MLREQSRERSWKPMACLRPFVNEFNFREQVFGKAQKYVPLSARSDCFLQFYLKERYRIVNVFSGDVHLAPRCVLVGPHSRRREDLLCSGHLRIFTIRFSAVGFRALFGIPARHIAEYADAADAVLGESFREFEDRLACVPVAQMPVVADDYLSLQLASGRGRGGGLLAGELVRSLEKSHGGLSIDGLGAQHGLSVRQVERTFLEHVGLTPKVFGRLVRLKRAMALGEREAVPDWAGIAAASGFFDQPHMIREFRSFNSATPVQFETLKRQGSVAYENKEMSPLSNRAQCWGF